MDSSEGDGKVKSFMSSYVKDMFNDVKPKWRKLLFHRDIKPLMFKALKSVEAQLRSCGVGNAAIETNGLAAYIRPAPENIFRAFTYFDLDDLRTVIVGQDPYPKAKDAMGLSFSVPPDVTIPRSLKKIYDCLQNYEFINSEPSNGDLTSWAQQGVLMLNRYLTRQPKIETQGGIVSITGDGGSDKDCLHTFWEDFTAAVIKKIIHYKYRHEQPISLMLWGVKGQGIMHRIEREIAANRCHVLTWGHPSPLSTMNHDKKNPKNFLYCDHFTRVNEILSEQGLDPIDWGTVTNFNSVDDAQTPSKQSPEKQENSSEGSSGNSGNEEAQISTPTPTPSPKKITPVKKPSPKKTPEQSPKKTPKQSPKKQSPKKPSPLKDMNNNRIVVFTDGGCTKNGAKDAVASYGIYWPAKFLDQDNVMPEHRMCGRVPPCGMDDRGKWDKNKRIPPTNNRGEMLAIIYALQTVLKHFEKHNDAHPVMLVSDSTYCINIINKWIWNWHKSDVTFSHKKNPDLLRNIWRLLTALEVKYIESGQSKTMLHPRTPDSPGTNWPGLAVIHQRSHKTPPMRDTVIKTGGLEFEKHAGNETADALCNKAVTFTNYRICRE